MKGDKVVKGSFVTDVMIIGMCMRAMCMSFRVSDKLSASKVNR